MAYAIKTPHAAVKIWNYTDRVTDEGTDPNYVNQTKEEIISTLSLQSIQTSKSKSNPVGTFNFVLAPTRNWVSVITPGSWCVILMSNNPITKKAFEAADPAYVKMLGRINSVRAEVVMAEDGTRSTRFLVSGEDWGSVFNNIFYMDPLILDPGDHPDRLGNTLYVQFLENVFSKDNTPTLFSIPQNLQLLLTVFGAPFEKPHNITRIAKPTHRINLPSAVFNYFGFADATKKKATTTDIAQIVTLQTGALNSTEGEYDTNVKDGMCWFNPMDLLGQHTLWSILMDTCNHALNELYTDFRWLDAANPQLALYSRIRPFSFQKTPVKDIDPQLRSMFQNIPTHRIEDVTITAANVGTNWKDKYNFIEIKPTLSGFEPYDNATKLKSQAYQKIYESGGLYTEATDVFDREGFRPLIYTIKHVPTSPDFVTPYDENRVNKWVNMMQEWFFDSHRLLNGTISMTGTSEYIPVGDNIMFDAGIIGITQNYNSDAAATSSKCYVLAHVENISHTFSVTDGVRHFQTDIQFVRGIIVDENKNLIGEGVIDKLSTALSNIDSTNHNVIAMPTKDDPNKD